MAHIRTVKYKQNKLISSTFAKKSDKFNFSHSKSIQK